MAGPKNDLDELADMISAAVEKARQLNMHTSAYILSMALAEVSKAAKAASSKPNGGKTS
ncbi:MAG TPA: hypothetical protein VK767_18665 [Bradyrhizobium sp.]|jgi:hypothetical protein|nr:hypothetical protein [Bradyrhizobium sp.]